MKRLRELIDSRSITQKQLAAELGYPLQTFNNYVRGEREPDLDAINKICDYFNCTADYLIGRSSVPYAVMSTQDAQLLETYHALPLEIRRAVDGLMAPYRTTEKEAGAVS